MKDKKWNTRLLFSDWDCHVVNKLFTEIVVAALLTRLNISSWRRSKVTTLDFIVVCHYAYKHPLKISSSSLTC